MAIKQTTINLCALCASSAFKQLLCGESRGASRRSGSADRSVRRGRCGAAGNAVFHSALLPGGAEVAQEGFDPQLMQLITPRELAAVFKGHPAEKGASSPARALATGSAALPESGLNEIDEEALDSKLRHQGPI